MEKKYKPRTIEELAILHNSPCIKPDEIDTSLILDPNIITLQEEKEQNDRIKSNDEAKDKMILTLSLGFLGAFPFLFEKLIFDDWSRYLIVAIISSIGFSLVCTLLSFWVGNKALNKYLEGKECLWWMKFDHRLNCFSLISMGFCIILFCYVIGYNVLCKNNGTNKQGIVMSSENINQDNHEKLDESVRPYIPAPQPSEQDNPSSQNQDNQSQANNQKK